MQADKSLQPTATPTGDKYALRQRYARVAKRYAAAAGVLDEITARLLARLDYIKYAPRQLLDIGCGAGSALQLLRKRYPKAQLLGGDLCLELLQQIPRSPWRRATPLVQADFESLPLRAQSIDLLLASSVLQYSASLVSTFAEWARVIRPQGLMLWVSFGPDTLCELRACLQQLGLAWRLPAFMDMHDLGDAMLQAGWVDPVVDTEILHVTYPSVRTGLRELLALAPRASYGGGLMTHGQLQRLEQLYPRNQDGRVSVTLELVYGHAWGANARQHIAGDKGREVRISVDAIQRRF